jgi:hypothetical protein
MIRQACWALPVRLANHARAAMRRPLIVRRDELFDPQDRLLTLCQLLCSRAAHGTKSENDYVVFHKVLAREQISKLRS